MARPILVQYQLLGPNTIISTQSLYQAGIYSLNLTGISFGMSQKDRYL